MKKLANIIGLVIAILLMSACTNTGAKDYEEIRECSVKCVEKALKKLTSNKALGDIMSPQWLMLVGEPTDIQSDIQSDIADKFNGVDYRDVVISHNLDTIMDGSKFCYSLVNVKLPDSSSFQFLVKFDGDGATGTEGKAKIRATRGLINKTSPTGMFDSVKYQVDYSHFSDLSDCYEQYCAHYVVKAIKPFIEQFNAKRRQTLYSNLVDFKGFLTTDTLAMPERISFHRSNKRDLLSIKYCFIKCGDVVLVFDGEKIVDSYGLFNGLGYSINLPHSGYAFCSGADGIINQFFENNGNNNVSDLKILENIKKVHDTQCSRGY